MRHFQKLCIFDSEFHVLGIEQIELWASDCSKAAIQLIRSGRFPCSPIYPTLAIDIRVLDFIRRLFLRIAPNHTAWCSAATDFLAAQGYHLPGEDPLRRRFANSLHWFMSLVDMTKARIDIVLQHSRKEIVPQSSTSPVCLDPGTHCGRPPLQAGQEECDEVRTSGTTTREGDNNRVEEERHRKRGRECEDEGNHLEEDDNRDAREEETLSHPTEYLRSRCPACFGGNW